LERLNLARVRLREIQNEATAIYRRFPELDRRPRSGRGRRPSLMTQRDDRVVAWPAKLH
jgi:hypothetical protein